MKRTAKQVGFATFMALALSFGAHAAQPAAVPGPAEPTTVVPTGAYQVAAIALSRAWFGDADLPVRLAIRDGQVVAAWFVVAEQAGNGQRMWSHQITAAIKGERLTGDIAGRRCTAGMGGVIGDYTFTLDARISQGQLTGTYKATLGAMGGAKGRSGEARESAGALAGTLRDEGPMKRENVVAGDWPDYFGASGGWGGPKSRSAPIEDLSQARPLWVSEDLVPTGWGDAPDGRYMKRVMRVGLCGGTSSPVVADGRVYQFYYVPSGPLKDEPKVRAEAAELSPHPVEQRRYVDWGRPYADDVIVCMDAATGQTLWKTTLPGRDFNNQTHKWRGFNPTPAVADGRLFVVNYAGRAYALDARNGRLLWEHPAAPAAGTQPGNAMFASGTGPVVLGDVVVAPLDKVTALEAATGTVLWTGPRGRPLGWSSAGQHYAIVCSRGTGQGRQPSSELTCFEATAGRKLWTVSAGVVAAIYHLALVHGDDLISVRPDDSAAAAKGSAFPSVVCYRLKPEGPEPKWTFSPRVNVSNGVEFGMAVVDGRLFVNGTDAAFCVNLEDGKPLASLEGAGGGPGNITTGADGRLLIHKDGAHGSMAFDLLKADPADFRVLGKTWNPPNPPTGAYHQQPLVCPIVDGRWFVRGPGGIYCYDLRVRGQP
jgi:outer membrane protein assembly factor BamB